MSNYGGLPDRTRVCSVHLHTYPPVHVSKMDTCSYTYTRIQVYAYECLQFFSVRLFSIRRVSEYSACESKVQQVLLARGIKLCEYSVYASRCMPVLQEHAPLYCALVRVRRWMQVDDSTRVILIGYHVRWVESLDVHFCNLPYLSDSAWRISKVRNRDTYGDCDMTDVCVVGNRQVPSCSV